MTPDRPIIPVEEQFAIMADNAPVLIWIAGTDKLCYFFNAGWLKFTGRTMEQEYGNGWAEGLHPDDLERCLDIYVTAFDARQEFKMEYRLKRHDGVYQWIIDYGVPRYTSDGTFAGYIGSCMVIDELMDSERMKKVYVNKQVLENEQDLNEELISANEELAETQEMLHDTIHDLRLLEERSAKLAAIVESSDDAIISKNLDGIIASWNRGAEQIFGYTEAEMVGQSVLKLIPEDLHHEEPFILGRLRKGEKIEHYETMRRTQSGRLIDVSLTISPIRDKEGKIIGVSKIARDISEQKRDEQRKNDFIGMVSHELKTPLTSLSAIVQMANLKLKNSSDTFLSGAMEKAATQVKRMSTLINGFLNVSRLESGKLMIDKKSFVLDELVREVVKESELVATTHIIHTNICDDIPVFADRDKIESVISNLLSNAIKYSPKGNNIYVTCEIINNWVTVSIRDEGMGIKATDLDKIFDRYYRVETDGTNHISGFGIGLYLSAEIIHRHDGKIWAESETGKGSTFFFSLPLSK